MKVFGPLAILWVAVISTGCSSRQGISEIGVTNGYDQKAKFLVIELRSGDWSFGEPLSVVVEGGELVTVWPFRVRGGPNHPRRMWLLYCHVDGAETQRFEGAYSVLSGEVEDLRKADLGRWIPSP